MKPTHHTSIGARTRRTTTALLAMALVLVGLAMPTPAPAIEIEPPAVDELSATGLTITDGEIQLSLDQAVQIALERNLGLIIERYNWVQTRAGVLQSLGIYDLDLTGSLLYQDTTQPNAVVVEGVPVAQSTTTNFSLGLSQLLATGAVASVDVFGRRSETNSLNQALNPLYSASASLEVRQPLLRNRGRLPTERGIMVARSRVDEGQEVFERRLAETIQQVQQAYWDLVEARDQLVVAQEALDLAQVLDEQNRVRVEVGTLAPLELIQSEAGIANRESDIIAAEARIGDAQDVLREILNLEQSGRMWDVTINPTTDPATELVEVDLDEALATAMTERPELAAQRSRMRILEIDREFFRQNMLPSLDVVANYSLSGLAGTGEIPGDPSSGEGSLAIAGDLTDAFDDVVGGDFDTWSVQLLFSYPLQNSEAKAQQAIADYDYDRGLAQLEQLRNQILTEVRSAQRRVETAAKQIEAARVSRQLEEQNLDAERKRYENGMSSSFRILQIQEDLTQARSREVNAVTAYRRALAELFRATGTLVDAQGVDVDYGMPFWEKDDNAEEAMADEDEVALDRTED